MYIISGEFKVKSQSRNDVIDMSLKLIPQSLSENGCISYQFLEDQANKGNFLFFERWKSREAIGEHFEKSYFKDFAERFPSMIDGQAKIEIYEIANIEKV